MNDRLARFHLAWMISVLLPDSLCTVVNMDNIQRLKIHIMEHTDLSSSA